MIQRNLTPRCPWLWFFKVYKIAKQYHQNYGPILKNASARESWVQISLSHVKKLCQQFHEKKPFENYINHFGLCSVNDTAKLESTKSQNCWHIRISPQKSFPFVQIIQHMNNGPDGRWVRFVEKRKLKILWHCPFKQEFFLA